MQSRRRVKVGCWTVPKRLPGLHECKMCQRLFRKVPLAILSSYLRFPLRCFETSKLPQKYRFEPSVVHLHHPSCHNFTCEPSDTPVVSLLPPHPGTRVGHVTAACLSLQSADVSVKFRLAHGQKLSASGCKEPQKVS